MKATCVLVLVVCANLVVVRAAAPGAIRAMDPAAAEAYDHGLAISPTFRALAAEFDRTRVVVHVVTGDIRIFGARGTTRLASAIGEWRYVRIVLDPRLPVPERTAVLAHELQHAREIAVADVSTQSEVRQLYERIGRSVSGTLNAFETADAAAAGVRVWQELRAAGSARQVRATAPLRLPAPIEHHE